MSDGHMSNVQPNTPDWPAYHQAVAGSAPRAPLLAALNAFDRESRGGAVGSAVDLGCGGGTDTVELLRRGWRVLAIDAEPSAIDQLRTRTDLTAPERLETQVNRLELASWPIVDLVNASLVLPFLDPEAFGNVWARIVRSLRSGGRFSGHFFGDHDAWAAIPGRCHHTRKQVDSPRRFRGRAARGA